MRTLIVTLIFLPMLGMAQENLVPNSSFEEYTSCPTGWTHDWSRVVHWSNGNISSPDYFNICSEPDIFPPDTFPRRGVPENIFGTQSAKDGYAYMGFYGVQFGNAEWREYIQVELTRPLYYRIRYVVSFYVSLSESSRYAISTLGAHLSVDAISSNDLLVLDAEPQILPDPLQPIIDTTEWVLITDTFVSAQGGEKYLTIGNFFSDAESDTMFFNPNPPLGNRHAYYYIDDVSVIALDSMASDVGIAEQEVIGFSVYPNPATDVVRFRVLDPSASRKNGTGSSSVGMMLRVLDAAGREVKALPSFSERDENGSVDVSTLPQGIYFLELTDGQGRKAVRKFVKG